MRLSGITVSVLAFAAFAGTASAQTAAPGYSIEVAATGLTNPMDVAVDGAGFVYVADSGAGRILKGTPGSFSPIVTGIAVAPFIGINIGPSGLAVSGSSLYWGESGRDTGVERVYETNLSGGLIQELPAAELGGNWTGLTVDSQDQLLAVSANGDKVYASSRGAGGQYGDFGVWISTQADGLVSPTGVAQVGNRLFVSYYGSFGELGGVAMYDALTAEIINPFQVPDLFAPTAIEATNDGRLLIVEYGFDFNDGRLSIYDPATNSVEVIVTGLARAAGVAMAPDGSIYVTEQATINQPTGRLLRVVPTPGALAMLGLAGLAACRRRR
jgi:streptogramin lyase